MLPPIENSVLQSNPKFALLHATLSKNVLDPSGATKNHPAQKEREAVSESLKVARIQAAKSYLIRSALRNLDLSSPTSSKSKSKPQQSSLPPELIELILILSSHLSTPNLPRTSKALLESTEQWATLPIYLPQISMLVSAHLHIQALGLARILSPTSNPSFLHRQIPKLIPSICDQQAEISNKKLELERHRTDLVSMTTTLLGLYHMAITFIIHILEQNKHGAIARNAKIRAEYLSLSAQKEAVEAKILFGKGEKMVYTEEVKGALTNYVLNLRDGRDRLKEKRRMLEKQLWGYGVGREDALKEKTMREIARVYEGMMREIEEVGRDVERLRGR